MPQQKAREPGDIDAALQVLVQQVEAARAPAAAPARPLRWTVVVLAAVGAAALALGNLASWWRPAPHADSAPAPAATPMPRPVHPSTSIMKVSGFFTAHELVEISATVLARVKSIRVREGASVRQGELLVELSNVRGDEDVRSAQEHLAAEQLGAEKAELGSRHEIDEQKRQADLFSKGFGTRQAMAQADLRLGEARLERERSRRSVADALANLRATRNTQREYAIRAPFAGVVVAQNARVGEVVSPTNGGSYIRSGLLALLNPATLQVEVSVQERLLPQLRSAGCALVSSLAQPDQIRDLPFQLNRISNTADRQRGAVTALLVPLRPMPVLPILQTSAEVEFVHAGDRRCPPPIAK